MKSLFLYQNISYQNGFPSGDGVYRFDKSDLIGIDTMVVDKKNRRNIVDSFRLREFFVIQRWFGLLICYASKLSITITDVKLKGTIEEVDANRIEDCIRLKDNTDLAQALSEINEDGEHDIESLSFMFFGQLITISATGVLETYADDTQFERVVSNDNIWHALMGRENWVR